jgi:hypothetical protein
MFVDIGYVVLPSFRCHTLIPSPINLVPSSIACLNILFFLFLVIFQKIRSCYFYDSALHLVTINFCVNNSNIIRIIFLAIHWVFQIANL